MMAQIRIGHTLNEREKGYVAERKKIIYDCLKRNKITSTLAEVPNIAVLGSGGGERAMIGLLGLLSEMGKNDLLDMILYLSGVSGSTWCMAAIYEQTNWSNKMEQVKQQVVKRVGGETVSITKRGKKLVEYYYQKDNFSLTDVWAALVVPAIVKKLDDRSLSSYHFGHDKDPFPVFTVTDKDSRYDNLKKEAFFELTPLEAGYSLAGAFVETSSFGCQFYKGALKRKQPEMDMNYIQGLCGSVLADIQVINKTLMDWIKGLAGEKMMKENTGVQLLHTTLKLNLYVSCDKNWTPVVKDLNELLKGKKLLQGSGNELQIETEDWENSPAKIREHIQRHTLDICQNFFHWHEELRTDEWLVVVKSIEKVSEKPPLNAWTHHIPEDITVSRSPAPADKAETMMALLDWMKSETCGTDMAQTKGFNLLLTVLELNHAVLRGAEWTQLVCLVNKMLEGKKNQAGENMQIEQGHWTQVTPKTRENLALELTLAICGSFFSWFDDLENDIMKAIVKDIIAFIVAILEERWIWGTTYNFLHHMDGVEVDQSVLAGKTRHFEDAGLLLNSPFFSVLRPEREIDLIISFDFSEGDPMETVVETMKKCKEMGLPFPDVDVSNVDRKTPKDMYVFKGYGKAPTVIHMPLFNIVNCGKDLEWWRKEYTTFQLPYSSEMIDMLLVKAGENITHNKDKLLQEIKSAIGSRPH